MTGHKVQQWLQTLGEREDCTIARMKRPVAQTISDAETVPRLYNATASHSSPRISDEAIGLAREAPFARAAT
jgi:hypothetical protein